MTDRTVEDLAYELRSMAAVQHPVHLQSIARKFGVSEIRDVDIVEEGRLWRKDDRTVIELRQDRPSSRRRFTLAHELAHLILDERVDRPCILRQRSASAPEEAEESLCDAVAAAVLMPTVTGRAHM